MALPLEPNRSMEQNKEARNVQRGTWHVTELALQIEEIKESISYGKWNYIPISQNLIIGRIKVYI